MFEQEPKPKIKASALTPRRGPPRVLLGYDDGNAFYLNANCDAVRMALSKYKVRHTALETAFAAEKAALKVKFENAVSQLHAEILSEIEDIVKIGGIGDSD
jgi:hypothetical protein